MLDKRKKRTMIFIIVIVLFMATSLILENLSNQTFNNNVQEIPLPEEEHHISAICDMKVDGKILTLATMTSLDDAKRTVAEIWETSNNGKSWTKLYEKEFLAPNENGQACPMISFVGEKSERECVITFAFWEGSNSLYSEQKYYYIKDYLNTEYEEIFVDGQKQEYYIPPQVESYYENGVIYSYDVYRPNCVTRINVEDEVYERIKIKNADIITIGLFDEKGSYLDYGADYDSGYTSERVQYDFETGKKREALVLKELSIDLKTYYDSYGICLDPKRNEGEEGYYYICRNGLYHYNKAGKTLVEKINFPKAFTRLRFNNQMLFNDEGDLYINYSNQWDDRFEQKLIKVKME